MDPRKRQKKLERRHAKEKARKKALAKYDPRALTTRIERATSAPLLQCCTTEVLWDQGLSNVVVSRELESGKVAFAAFLLDVYCLGVKDVVLDILPRGVYDRQVYEKMLREHGPVPLELAAAWNLIEGAVEYAQELGFPPHPDYRKARLIFGDVDPNASSEQFAYGKDGKPFFIAGPNDRPGRCQQIISTLTAKCGPDGFHYLMPMVLG